MVVVQGATVQRKARFSRNTRIGGFLGIELKFYDTSLVGNAITAPTDASGGEQDPSATVLFNTVVQGDGESNRDGRQIIMKSLGIRGNISVASQINQTAIDAAPIVFMALVHDTQTNGATVNSEDVFKNGSGSAVCAANPFRNLQFVKRFRVLKSKTIKLHQMESTYDGTNIEEGGYTIPFSMFVDLKSMTVNYSGTTETVANITDNSLHLIAYTTSVSQAPQMNYNARLRFVG